MEGLRIAKPAVLAEGENVNVNVVTAQAARRAGLQRNRPINEEEEEVWSVPIPNIKNVNDEEKYANTGTPVRPMKSSYRWLFNKPETPKVQAIKSKNKPPPLRRGGSRKRKIYRKRATQRRNRKY